MADGKRKYPKSSSSLHISACILPAKFILDKENDMAIKKLSGRALQVTWQNPWLCEGWKIKAINAFSYHIYSTHERKTFKKTGTASPNSINIFRKKNVIIILSFGSFLPSLKLKVLNTGGIEAYPRKNSNFTNCFLSANEHHLRFCVSSVFRTKYIIFLDLWWGYIPINPIQA